MYFLATGTLINPAEIGPHCTPSLLNAVMPVLVGQRRARDGNDTNELLEPRVVAWVGGVKGKIF
jgi:hypothetical protein